ncbi:hypothetical protein GQ457_18G015530 [Hibiscus cannabinus]
MDSICTMLGFQCVSNSWPYLGVPVRHTRANSDIYNFLIDKLQTKLSGWSARTLSFSGRLTLAKSVLMSVPTYVMHASKLPNMGDSNILGVMTVSVTPSTRSSRRTDPRWSHEEYQKEERKLESLVSGAQNHNNNNAVLKQVCLLKTKSHS